MQKVPFGVTQFFVILCQASGLIIAAYAATVSGSLIGVILASFGGGVGAVNILSLATHFPKETVKSWSTGWGAAGIVASLCYAAFTEAHFANLSIKTTLLLMLGSPIFYAIAYWIILEMPKSVHQVEIFNFKSYYIKNIKIAPVKTFSSPPTSEIAETAEMPFECEKEEGKKNLGFIEKLKLFVVFKKYTVPLFFVYFGQYLINQGLLLIAAFLTVDSMLFIVPNITLIFPFLILEGLITGSSYGNTIYRIHADVPKNIKEIVMSTITVAYSLGTVSAAFTAIPLHNYVCDKQIRYFM
uniref:Battenin n=1 Tax=Panagrolaimus sp. ES5 TaxID=591445 RepID=A0AC34FHK9_9BILA